MNLIVQLAVSGVLLVGLSQPSLAVQVVNQPAAMSTNTASFGVIDRGGTITAVNKEKRILTVDGVQYVLPAKPITVHEIGGKGLEKDRQLKVGMQIRFTTSKANYSAQEQIQEIWVTGLARKTASKPK